MTKIKNKLKIFQLFFGTLLASYVVISFIFLRIINTIKQKFDPSMLSSFDVLFYPNLMIYIVLILIAFYTITGTLLYASRIRYFEKSILSLVLVLILMYIV